MRTINYRDDVCNLLFRPHVYPMFKSIAHTGNQSASLKHICLRTVTLNLRDFRPNFVAIDSGYCAFMINEIHDDSLTT